MTAEVRRACWLTSGGQGEKVREARDKEEEEEEEKEISHLRLWRRSLNLTDQANK